MITFTTVIKKFLSQGEKTGWTYIDVKAQQASALKPGNKKSFRVKGWLDEYAFEKLSLVPMGGGDFILPLNGTIRKHIRKSVGDLVVVKMEVDERTIEPPSDFIECLKEEPSAEAKFRGLPPSHQHYFSNWINSAKTEATKTKRIAQSVNALAAGLHFGEMIRKIKSEKIDLPHSDRK